MTWWRRRSDRLDDEMQQHIDFETEQNIAAGMPPGEARSAALRKFGNVSLAKEESREVWGWLWLERLWQDTVYGLRGLVHTPGFTIVALLSLMLGIGASTSLFSVIYGVLIAPYPYKNPDQIWAPAVISPKEPSNGWHQYRRRELLAIRNLPGVATAMATTYESTLLTGTDSPESFYGVLVTGNAFDFLGVKPLIGRTIEPFDIRPDGTPEPVVVLNYRFWQRKFNGDSNAIGQKLILNDVPRTVIGVMPPRFGWFTDDAFWLPMGMDLADETPLNAIVRLRPGITKEIAEQQLQSLNVQLAAEKPQNFPKGGFRSTLLNYLDITVASGAMKSSLHLLLVAVGFLLLIACVNVANLQLARTTARAREIAVRLSVGASRPRLIRQLLTESILLSVLGGALGILFAIGATRAIAALMPDFYKPNEARITMNVYVLVFSLAVSLVTGILFGLTPAFRCSRPDLAGTLKDGGRGAVGSASGQKVRGWLVAAEVALSVILLAGASLAIRSFAQLSQIDPGFQPQKTLMVDVPLPPKRYATLERRNTFARSLLESVSGLPGVEAAALGNGGMPFGGPRSAYSIDGQLPAEDRRIVVSFISSDYPRALGITLKRGRTLTAQEVADGTHVALINQTAAKLWTAGESPIGRRIRINLLSNPGRPQLLVPTGVTPDVTIVGILGDTTNAGLREATLPGVYVPYTLLAPPSRVLALRTFGDPMTVLNAVRQKVRELDKDQPLSQPITLKEILGFQTVQPRFNMALFSTFAALGLALAAIGIYSVISYGVAQRMHEIGVRMALGARRGDVLAIVLRMVAKVAAIGLAIG
ncbi:MAG TPA: ABC transporter permease, partial [Bryobacteraceae bacterium]